jgi:hypothetical protein
VFKENPRFDIFYNNNILTENIVRKLYFHLRKHKDKVRQDIDQYNCIQCIQKHINKHYGINIHSQKYDEIYDPPKRILNNCRTPYTTAFLYIT